MGLGPERIFQAGLKELLTRTEVEFESEEISLDSTYPTEISSAFELCRKVADRVRQSRAKGQFPIVLSGNCITAVGTVSGCGPDHTGVVWFDAHGESTTPDTTTSGFLDGMPISTLLGRAWPNITKIVPGFTPIPGNRVLLFGARDVEPAERVLLENAGVLQPATLHDFNEQVFLLAQQTAQVYIHVDLDVLDPTVATANQWTSPNGLTLDNLLSAVAEIPERSKVAALCIASYDPTVDRNGRALDAALRVAETVLSTS